MGETPDDIREEIEATRERMGDTVEALGYKADVKSRVKDSVGNKKDSLVGAVSGGKDAVVGRADSIVSRVGGIVPEGEQVKGGYLPSSPPEIDVSLGRAAALTQIPERPTPPLCRGGSSKRVAAVAFGRRAGLRRPAGV